ncbi:unnamed protein product, partial [Rotaria sordida]
MARRIRRSSMERLKLYDLDNLKFSSSNRELPPPLPPPRKCRRHPLDASQTFEHYHFLCNMKRHSTDPIYAATPMFTIIPQSTRVKHPRRLLGSRLPSYIIKPISTTSTSPEQENAEINNDTKEEESSDDDDYQQNRNDDNSNKRDNDDDNRNSSSSSDNDEG